MAKMFTEVTFKVSFSVNLEVFLQPQESRGTQELSHLASLFRPGSYVHLLCSLSVKVLVENWDM